MKKINFTKDVLPHALAVAVFFIVTIFFFNPIFFKNQSLNQSDIQQWSGSSKELRDFREKTGEEGLWAESMFGGMPAYLINVQWSNNVVNKLKNVMSLWLPHPVANIFLAFICYYIMLLSFGVRPYLAIGGAIAFGLCSYIIIGLSAGHNGRIGAIAFMPLIITGVHLAFTNKFILGFCVTALGFALHLRENHLQITYYLALIIIAYGLVQFIEAIRQKKLVDYFKTVALLIAAALIGLSTFFGQLWAVTEYTAFSIRGKSELVVPGKDNNQSGLDREYAFAYNYGILEPMTILIPEFYGGSSMRAFVEDKKSESYKALSQASDNKQANELASYTVHYWGPQAGTAGPYYGGAVILFLFVIGILFANKKYVWWLVSLSVLSIFLSWGESFSTFNYLMFDYLPGYNKFRSVNFALIIIFLAMPLLGLLGLEKVIAKGIDKTAKKKLLIALSVTGGFCLVLLLFGGMMSFMKEGEGELPAWFSKALIADRKSLLKSDAFRSLVFIVLAFIPIYFELWKKITPFAFYAFLSLIIIIDMAVVNKRYFTDNNFKRKNDNTAMAITEADQEILKDKSYYRVYNLRGTMAEARTSYYHYSIGGYHGAKMRRYQDLYDSCIVKQTNEFINDAQSQKLNFEAYGILNMLNIKYIMFGDERTNVIPNDKSNGSAWFVNDVVKVKSANEELEKTFHINTKTTAVIDETKFKIPTSITSDSASTITILDHKPNYLKYESQSSSNALVVFSEIYYPKGWQASIDGKEAEILRANYVLRALAVPAGKHTIEFKFKPEAYFVGDKISLASSWLLLFVLLAGFGWTLKKEKRVVNQ